MKYPDLPAVDAVYTPNQLSGAQPNPFLEAMPEMLSKEALFRRLAIPFDGFIFVLSDNMSAPVTHPHIKLSFGISVFGRFPQIFDACFFIRLLLENAATGKPERDVALSFGIAFVCQTLHFRNKRTHKLIRHTGRITKKHVCVFTVCLKCQRITLRKIFLALPD